MSLTKGEIFSLVSKALKGNEEHENYSNELSKHYRYLKLRLPPIMREHLDKFYLSTLGVETVAIETAYYAGRNHAIKEAATND